MVADRVLGLAFVALGLAMVLGARGVESTFSQLGDPGPRLLPTALGIGMATLGTLLAVRRRVIESDEEGAASAEPATEKGLDLRAPPSRIVQVALAAVLVAYVALFERLGFTLATFGFLAAAILLLGSLRPAHIAAGLALAAAATLAVGAFLAGVIGVPLPGVLLP